MSRAVQVLTLKVGGDITEALKGLDKLAARTQKLGRDMQRAGKTLSRNVTAPLAAVGAAAVGAGVRLGNMADELLDLEQQTGLSTTALQEFRRVATVAGVDQDVLGKAAEQLTRRMSRGAEGSADLRHALDTLGISAHDASGNLRPMEDVVNESLTALADMEDVTTRNVLATKLFSRAATDIAPVLGLGSEAIAGARQEAHELGMVLDRDALEAANRFRVQWQTVRDSLKASVAQIGMAVIPVLSSLTETIQTRVVPMIRKAVEWFRTLDPETLKVAAAIGAVAASIGPLLIVGGKMIGMLAMVATPAGLAVAAIAALATTAYTVVKNWDVLKLQGTLIWTAIKAAVLDAVGGILGALEKMTSWIPVVGNKVTELREKFDRFAEESLANSGERIRELEMEINNNFVPALQATTAAANEATTAVEGLGGGSGGAGIAEPVVEMADTLNRVLIPSIQKVGPAARKSGKEGAEGMGELGDRVAEIGSGGLDAIADFATGSRDAIKNFVKSAIADLTRLAVKMAALKLVGGLVPGGGIGASILGGILGRASGGPVRAGQPYWVGEQGRELVVPSQSGTVVPEKALGGDVGSMASAILSRLGPPPSGMSPEAAATHDWYRRLFGAMVEDGRDRGVSF